MPSDFTIDSNFEIRRDGTGDFKTNSDERYVRDRIVREARQVVQESTGPLTSKRRQLLVETLSKRLEALDVTTSEVAVTDVSFNIPDGVFALSLMVDGKQFTEVITR